MRDLVRILALWRKRAGLLALGLLVSLASITSGIALTATAGGLVARLFGGAGGAVAAAIGTAVALRLSLHLLGPLRVVLRYAERLVTHEATFRALADLRVWFFRGVVGSAAGGLGFRRAGDVLGRLVSDIDALDGLYLRLLVPAATALLLLPVLVGAAMLLPGPGSGLWLAAVLAGLFLLAAFVFPWAAWRMAERGAARLAGAGAALRIASLDAVSGVREIRAFEGEGRAIASVQAREGVLITAQADLARDGARAGAASFLCGQAGIAAVLLAAVLASGTGPVTGTVGFATLAFVGLAAFEAIGGLPRAGVLAGHAATSARRVIEAAEQPAPVPDPPVPVPGPASGALRFESIRFRWREDRPELFDGLTLDIAPGSRVAILGPSGSGKSTLAALAMKVAAPQEGRVTLGGVDLARLRAADVRARIGWLSQATHLFSDTIRANLALARPDAEDAALWAALDAARISEVVRALPGGLDHWIGEGGTGFSGGQGRRLALARTLLSPAPLLILDEPCAGLDAETEREFYATLNETAQGRTIVLIAHRLTGIEQLDRVWRLSNGRAVPATA